jgi:hypothetical protein
MRDTERERALLQHPNNVHCSSDRNMMVTCCAMRTASFKACTHSKEKHLDITTELDARKFMSAFT